MHLPRDAGRQRVAYRNIVDPDKRAVFYRPRVGRKGRRAGSDQRYPVLGALVQRIETVRRRPYYLPADNRLIRYPVLVHRMPAVLHDAQQRGPRRIPAGELQFVVVEDLVAILEIDEDSHVEALESELLVEASEKLRLRIAEDLAVVVGIDRAVPQTADLLVFYAARHRLRSRDAGIVGLAGLQRIYPGGSVVIEVARLVESVAYVAIHRADRLAHLDDEIRRIAAAGPTRILLIGRFSRRKILDLVLVEADIEASRPA